MKILVFLLLSTVCHTAYSLTVTTEPLHEGLEDETITLKCQFNPPSDGGSSYVITWTFTGEYTTTSGEVIYSQDSSGTGTAYGQFAGRASISGSRGDLRITKAQIEDTGDFLCDVNYYVAKDQGSASTRLEVYSIVNRVDIMEYYTGDYVYMKPGYSYDLTCKAYRGRPASRLIWYMDSREMGTGSDEFTDNRDGTYDTTSTFRYNSKREDHGKILKCQSDQEPEIDYRFEYDYITINTAGASTIVFSAVTMVISMLVAVNGLV